MPYLLGFIQRLPRSISPDRAIGMTSITDRHETESVIGMARIMQLNECYLKTLPITNPSIFIDLQATGS